MSGSLSSQVVGGLPAGQRAAPSGTRIDLDGVDKRYRIGEVDIDKLVGVDLHLNETSLTAGAGRCGRGTWAAPSPVAPP